MPDGIAPGHQRPGEGDGGHPPSPGPAKRPRAGAERGTGRVDVVDQHRLGRNRAPGMDARRGGEPPGPRAPDLTRTVGAPEAALCRAPGDAAERGGDLLGRIEPPLQQAPRGGRDRNRGKRQHLGRRSGRDRLGDQARDREQAAELERGNQLAADAVVRSGCPHRLEPGNGGGQATAGSQSREAACAGDLLRRAALAACGAARRRHQRGKPGDRVHRLSLGQVGARVARKCTRVRNDGLAPLRRPRLGLRSPRRPRRRPRSRSRKGPRPRSRVRRRRCGSDRRSRRDHRRARPRPAAPGRRAVRAG